MEKIIKISKSWPLVLVRLNDVKYQFFLTQNTELTGFSFNLNFEYT
jgi:hypothetical protein